MPGAKAKILVDDNASVRALLPVILATTGYEVHLADDSLSELSDLPIQPKSFPTVLWKDMRC